MVMRLRQQREGLQLMERAQEIVIGVNYFLPISVRGKFPPQHVTPGFLKAQSHDPRESFGPGSIPQFVDGQ